MQHCISIASNTLYHVILTDSRNIELWWFRLGWISVFDLHPRTTNYPSDRRQSTFKTCLTAFARWCSWRPIKLRLAACKGTLDENESPGGKTEEDRSFGQRKSSPRDSRCHSPNHRGRNETPLWWLISLLWLCWLPHPLRVSLRCGLLCLEQGLFASRLELMIRMMREKVFAATLALKLVDHSLRHCPENCSLIGRQLRHAVEGARCDFPQTWVVMTV